MLLAVELWVRASRVVPSRDCSSCFAPLDDSLGLTSVGKETEGGRKGEREAISQFCDLGKADFN